MFTVPNHMEQHRANVSDERIRELLILWVKQKANSNIIPELIDNAEIHIEMLQELLEQRANARMDEEILAVQNTGAFDKMAPAAQARAIERALKLNGLDVVKVIATSGEDSN